MISRPQYEQYPAWPDTPQHQVPVARTKWWITPLVAVPVGVFVFYYLLITFWLLLITGPLLLIAVFVAVVVSFALGVTYRNARPVGVGIMLGFVLPVAWILLFSKYSY